MLNGWCQPSKPADTFSSISVTYFWFSRRNTHPQTQEVFCIHQHMHINCIKLLVIHKPVSLCLLFPCVYSFPLSTSKC